MGIQNYVHLRKIRVSMQPLVGHVHIIKRIADIEKSNGAPQYHYD